MSNCEKLGYLIEDAYLQHDPGPRHPESPSRLHAIRQALVDRAIAGCWTRVEPRAALPEELEAVHHPALVDRIERATRHAPTYLDPDTVVSEMSYGTALLATGGVLNCTEAICSGRLDRAFAFVRPPGHHAEPDRAMGFCLFNHIAVAAAWARKTGRLERVAVVDIDLHHGNGTQACFYDDPGVLYISTHQYPHYPGTGGFDETGLGEGRGYTLNFPLPAGTGDSTLVPLYSHIVAAVLEQYDPQLILVSAGFDAFHEDPLGGLRASAAGYGAIAASLIRTADRCCGGKICFTLEGGYSPRGLRDCTASVLAEMEAASTPKVSVAEDELFRAIARYAGERLGHKWKW